MPLVKVKKRFYDLENETVREVNDSFECDEARLSTLEGLGFVELAPSKPEDKNKKDNIIEAESDSELENKKPELPKENPKTAVKVTRTKKVTAK